VRTSTAAFIQASELRGKHFDFLDELVAAAEGRPIGTRPEKSVELTPLRTDTGLEIFAGGALARLSFDSNAPLIAFDSTYDDGPWGSRGGTIVGCDLWYRQDDGGRWVLDAIVPMKSTEIAIGYEAAQISEDRLRMLFGATPF
jgi:hypothetical protein